MLWHRRADRGRNRRFLVTRSLAELEIQHLLKEALPDWKWESMLMEVSDTKDVRVYTGVFMRLRLMQLLGISKAARVASIVYQSLQPLVPVQERRTFLRYGGSLLAGLAVLGLKPLRAHAQMVFESPDSETKVSGRYLSGDELQRAVTEATADMDYVIFRPYLLERGYREERGQATGILVETTGKDSVLLVTVPYTHIPTGGIAQVKYTKRGLNTETVMGTFHSNGNSTVGRIGVHEVVSGRVQHTRTFDFDPNGTITSREESDPSQTETVLMDLGTDPEVQIDKCYWCHIICRAIRVRGCVVGIGLICPGLCAIFTGPGFPACMILCALLVATLCGQTIDEGCDWACKDILKVCE